MKKISFFVASLFFTAICYAQPYKSIFGHVSTAWVFQWTNLSGTTHDSAYVEKDTIVNGVTYKKLLTQYPSFKAGLIREDTAVGLVWYRDLITTSGSYDTVEKIVFDFTLQAGDTFDILKTGLSDTMNIVDSVRVINGLKYIYFKAKIIGNEPYCLIEGVGSNYGIFLKHWGITLMAGQYLLCSYKDEIRTPYQNRRYVGDCNPPTGIVKLSQSLKDKIIVYPNPATTQLFVENNTNYLIQKVSIMSIDGRELMLSRLSSGALNISTLASGYYFLCIQLDNGPSIIKTFVIH